MMPGCTLASTGGTIKRQVNGRDYWVNVPDGLPGPSAPLLLGLHGFLQTPVTEAGIAGHEQTTGWSDIAATEKFIVAYPSASPPRAAVRPGHGGCRGGVARLQCRTPVASRSRSRGHHQPHVGILPA